MTRIRRWRVPWLAAAIGLASGCAPEVHVAADKPIVIQLDIDHEIRIKLDEEVASLLREERAATVQGRGAGEDADPATLDQLALEREKQAGRIAERSDGYLVAVPARPSAELAALVARVNARRRDAYTEIATEHGVEPRAVEAVAGARRTAAAGPGAAVMERDLAQKSAVDATSGPEARSNAGELPRQDTSD